MPANFGVAVLDNALLGKGTFGGVQVDSNSILISPEVLGDANADGTVDINDLNTVLNNFGAKTFAWTSGNFDGAGTVDLTDLADVINNFGVNNLNASGAGGSSLGNTGSPSLPTPEPASLAVMGMGLAVLLRRSRRSV
jgi:hypothetical protein